MMRLRLLFLITILFYAISTTESLPVRLYGLNYNTRQGPDWMPLDQRCKNRKQVWTDLTLLHKITDRVRLLSIRDCNQTELVLDVAREIGMQVWLGLWVDKDDSNFFGELYALENIVDRGLFDTSAILGVTVGSEALHRKEVTETKLVNYMDRVKTLLATSVVGGENIPVSVVDISYQYRQNEAMRNAVDVVYVNIFPYFNWHTNEHTWGAVGSLIGDARSVLDLSTSEGETKRLIIGETGWPSAGGRPGTEGRASPANQAQYFSNFFCRVDVDLSWEYYWFTGIDNDWRNGDNSGVEGTWGFFTSDLEIKPHFKDLSIKCDTGVYNFNETDWTVPIPPESCKAHAGCSAIAGDCCPTPDNVFLGCCENAPTPSPTKPLPTPNPTTSAPTITAAPTIKAPWESCQAHPLCWDAGLRGDCCKSGQELGKNQMVNIV